MASCRLCTRNENVRPENSNETTLPSQICRRALRAASSDANSVESCSSPTYSQRARKSSIFSSQFIQATLSRISPTTVLIRRLPQVPNQPYRPILEEPCDSRNTRQRFPV